MIKRLLFVITLFFIFIIGVNAYTAYNQGELVRYKNIAFYVMFDSDSSSESVQLLKMTPFTREEINRYTDNKAILTALSDNTLIYKPSPSNSIYGSMAYYYGDSCYYTIQEPEGYIGTVVKSGCKYDYESSNVKKVVDSWAEDNFDTNDVVIDQDGYGARLISVNEALVINSTPDAVATSSFKLENVPEWFTKISTGWTKDEGEKQAYWNNGTEKKVFTVGESLSLYDPLFYDTVRPTITLKKSSLKKEKINIYTNTSIREYKIGDIINYNDTKFYVIKNSSEKDSTITLLKDNPLSEYELEKYGEGYINNYIKTYYYSDTGAKQVTQGKVINEDGKANIAYLSTDKCYGYYEGYLYSSNYISDFSGCNYNYDISNVKHIVDNWFLDNINKNDSITDSTGYNARLINSDDLNNLGYVSIQVSSNYNENSKPGNDTPEFMLNKNTSGMLTMILSYTNVDSNTNINYYGITAANEGYSFTARKIPNSAIGTVRPVIILNKKEITNKITNVEEEEESDNIEVTIETKVDNSTLENNKLVSVPNTLLRKNSIFIFIGFLLGIIGIIIYRYNKKNMQ